jgi:hypothetical protein
MVHDTRNRRALTFHYSPLANARVQFLALAFDKLRQALRFALH